MKDIVFIVVVFLCIAGIVFNLPNALFRHCKHPERWATFERNVYGDEINLLNGRSIWKVKWWPFMLVHEYLKEEQK